MRRGMLGIGTLLALAFGGTARAGEIVTPSLLITNGTRFVCIATNVGKKPEAIRAEVINSDTGGVGGSNDCAAVAPGVNCNATATPLFSIGHCRFTSKAKLRAAIWVQSLSDNSVVSSLPATK